MPKNSKPYSGGLEDHPKATPYSGGLTDNEVTRVTRDRITPGGQNAHFATDDTPLDKTVRFFKGAAQLFRGVKNPKSK